MHILTVSDYQRLDHLAQSSIYRRRDRLDNIATHKQEDRWLWAHLAAHRILQGPEAVCLAMTDHIDEIQADFGALAILIPNSRLSACIRLAWPRPAEIGDILAWRLFCADDWERQLQVPWDKLGMYLLRTVTHAIDQCLWDQYIMDPSDRMRSESLAMVIQTVYPRVWDQWVLRVDPLYTIASL